MRLHTLIVGMISVFHFGNLAYADSSLEGEVTTVDAEQNSITIDTGDKKLVKFFVTSSTKYLDGLDNIEDAGKGDKISITFYSAMRLGGTFAKFRDDRDCLKGSLIMTAPNTISSTSCYATEIRLIQSVSWFDNIFGGEKWWQFW